MLPTDACFCGQTFLLSGTGFYHDGGASTFQQATVCSNSQQKIEEPWENRNQMTASNSQEPTAMGKGPPICLPIPVLFLFTHCHFFFLVVARGSVLWSVATLLGFRSPRACTGQRQPCTSVLDRITVTNWLPLAISLDPFFSYAASSVSLSTFLLNLCRSDL